MGTYGYTGIRFRRLPLRGASLRNPSVTGRKPVREERERRGEGEERRGEEIRVE